MAQIKRTRPADADLPQPKKQHIEEEAWTGFDEEEEDNSESENESKKEQKAKGTDSRPPTGAELRAIREAAALFGSSALKLQIDALLPKVRPKQSRIPPLDVFLPRLHTTLSTLPACPPAPPLAAARALHAACPAVSVPYGLPSPPENAAWSVACAPPSDIALVGSWSTRTGARRPDPLRWVVDLAVQMPHELFQEKDYLDARFFHKRAYYLACLAAAIHQDSSLNVDVVYDAPDGDSRMTTLLLTHRQDDSESDFSRLHAAIRILPVLPSPCPIALSHLSPSHGNIRLKTPSTTTTTATSSTTPTRNTPTPLYNTSLLLHTTPLTHLLRTHALTKEVPAARDALALLRVWATQRGFVPATGGECVLGFENRGYFWEALVCALVDGEESSVTATAAAGGGGGGGKMKAKTRTAWKPLGRGLSSYQLFRGALDFLSRRDFVMEPFFARGGTRYGLDSYSTGCDDGETTLTPNLNPNPNPVFVDGSSVNLLAGVPVASVEYLRYCAKRTLEAVNAKADRAEEAFGSAFLSGTTAGAAGAGGGKCLMSEFDVVVNVDLRGAVLGSTTTTTTKPMKKKTLGEVEMEVLEYGSPGRCALHTMANVLRKALGDRVFAIAVFGPVVSPRSVDAASASAAMRLGAVQVGLVLNPETAFRLVDLGPAAGAEDEDNTTAAAAGVDDTTTTKKAEVEARAFRAFWGPRAELRRFKDGRILESVVWEDGTSASTVDARAQVPVRIVRYVLERHLGIGAGGGKTGTIVDDDQKADEAVHGVQSGFDALLRSAPAFSRTLSVVGPALKPGFRSALSAFDGLAGLLKALGGEDNNKNKSDGGDGLPLAVLNVAGVSPALRYTSVFTPTPLPAQLLQLLHQLGKRRNGTSSSTNAYKSYMTYLPAMEVVLQFERSARWPAAFGPAQAVKRVFLEGMGRALMGRVERLCARVVLEEYGNGASAGESGVKGSTGGFVGDAYLEVVTPEGWAFAVRIWYERDPVLLQRVLEEIDSEKKTALVRARRSAAATNGDASNKVLEVGSGSGSESSTVRRHALAALRTYLLRFVHLPAHHRAVARLVHTYTAYAGTVRLVARWFAAHALLCTDARGRTGTGGSGSGGGGNGGNGGMHAVRMEAVEVLCARVFLEKGDVPPVTRERGFVCVLRMLSEWEWEEGMDVALYESGEEDGGEEDGGEDGDGDGDVGGKWGKEALVNGGSGGGNTGRGVWTLRTRRDRVGRAWTADGPDALTARRVRALASVCVKHIVANERGKLDPKALFVHPTDDYDILIRLKPSVLCRRHQAIVDSEDNEGSNSKYANLVGVDEDMDSDLESNAGMVQRVDFDPALMFFQDLEHVFSGTLAFFFDEFGGNVIGAVWDPALRQERPFRVLAAYSAMPVDPPITKESNINAGTNIKQQHQQKVVLNEEAVLADIQRLGEGLIETIEVRSC